MRVSVFGLGYVGCVTAGCLARAGHQVVGVDLSQDKVAMVQCQKWCKDETEEAIDVPPAEMNGQAKLLSDFANAIRSGTAASTSGADNLWSFGAVIAAMISATKGRAVDVADLIR